MEKLVLPNIGIEALLFAGRAIGRHTLEMEKLRNGEIGVQEAVKHGNAAIRIQEEFAPAEEITK